MYSRDNDNLELSKTSTIFGLDLAEKKQSLYEAVSDQIRHLSDYSSVTSDDLLKTVKDHIFKFLDIYVNSEVSSECSQYPAAIALSRALKMTFVILLEGKRIPLVIKQTDSTQTIFLAYDANKQFSSCTSRNILSAININDVIRRHSTDIAPPLESEDCKATLYRAAVHAIDKAVIDPAYLGWLQILLGPKINYPTKKFQMNLMNIENEIHLILLVLNAVIENSLVYIENDFFEKFVDEIKDQKKLTARDIKKRLNELQKELKDLQLKRSVDALKIGGASLQTISMFVNNFHLTYISGPVKFDTPATASREKIIEFEDSNKDEKKLLERIALIRVEEDEFMQNVTIRNEQLIEDVKLYLQVERSKMIQEMESTQWYDSNRNDIANYIENKSAEFIQRLYKSAFPDSCLKVIVRADNKSISDKMYKSELTFKKFLQNSLSNIRFEMKARYIIDFSDLKKIIDNKFEREKISIIEKNKRSYTLSNQDMLTTVVLNKCIEEITEILTNKLDVQSKEAIELIRKKFSNSSIDLLNLIKFLKDKAIAKQSKYLQLEKSFSGAVAETQIYKDFVLSWYLSHPKQISEFIRLIPSEEFAMMIIATDINKSPESLCEASSGDTLLHKTNAHIKQESKFSNEACEVILLLISHGANIFIQNNNGDFAYNFSDTSYLNRYLPIVKLQLETLITHGSNLADSVVSEILNYLTYNISSWSRTFENSIGKLERVNLICDIMLVLNKSRFSDSHLELAESLDHARSKLFHVNRSYLRHSLNKIFIGLGPNNLIDTPLVIKDLRKKLTDEKASHAETKKLLAEAKTEIERLSPPVDTQILNVRFPARLFDLRETNSVPDPTTVLNFTRRT